MDVPTENIRLSQRAKEQLVRLKRVTGITQWNILCRWAFCLSIADLSSPTSEIPPADSSVEMSWRTFAGPYQEVYLAILKERCENDGLGSSKDIIAAQFRRHLHRGISYLTSGQQIESISDFLRLVPHKS